MLIYQATSDNIEIAAELIKNNNLVAFPTETVYGLGAYALSEEAVKKIYALKKRPANNPLIVHIHSIYQVEEVAVLNKELINLEYFEKLSSLWPAALSIILPKKSTVPYITTANQETVALRIPKHEVALNLLRACNLPIAAPSANLANSISPTRAEHVLAEFPDSDLFILDGGTSEVGLESTVISLVNKQIKILRPGSLTKEYLEDFLSTKISTHIAESDKSSSPGQGLRHYSPKTPLYLTSDDKLPDFLINKNIARIRFEKANNTEVLAKECRLDICLSNKRDLKEVAKNLFATLRMVDSHNLDAVLIDTCPKTEIGVAIMNRLERAAIIK